ncbi:4-hydroxythreonine-4-phosphate dehydrogenase PdxA [uncultured Oxalicibacterium sp.]|uniref:4-hydroxythreonine-4-phosphate dehydrogenase PdxA n=1 Tax=uncultured Oxalicibacterium sp. TaxID=1168540 RepID=UPI0025F09753|nr:4-hydroxythreonine-4-phosphate dehydrogenase PdxA [uncultured Oxalicibacterium sp.]
MHQRPTIAVTCGEPAGIGPEISVRAACELRADVRSVLIGDAALLSSIAAAINPAIELVKLASMAQLQQASVMHARDQLLVLDCPLPVPVVAGRLDARNGLSVLHTLDLAIDAALQSQVDAIVTAPLQKSTINDAGVAFTGHTEYLAERTQTAQVVMMLATNATPQPLRVALATTHLPLKDVAAAITFDRLASIIDIVHDDLQRKFGIARPRIIVTGLNPHAGEDGYLGREEIDVITPVLRAAVAKGQDVKGPYPADTLFQQRHLANADCVLAMYHDQGLPVLKYASFGLGVNITLGLPIIRTSVDHGTALDLAAQGLGAADYGSMMEAIRVAAQMARASRTIDPS